MTSPILFQPISINHMDLRNRMVMPAMHLNYCTDGTVTDRLVRFYEERAKGGVGLIIVGGCLVDEWSGGQTMVGLDKDEYIPGLKALTAACKAHGAKVAAQLYMAGAYAHQALIRRDALSSSSHRSKFTNENAQGMTLEDIRMVTGDFVSAAVRAKEAGFDMVEVLAAAGYLISQFLSPVINKREDEYGGPLENRMRFGIDVIRAVRKAVGDDFCVGVRIAGNDFVPGSHTNKEAQLFARACQGAGADLINVTGGWHETRVPQITGDLPRAGFAYLARGIREAVSVPVAASNRIGRPDLAEELLREGFGDLICFGRSLIADPELPKKAIEGRNDEIRPCIACNQKCFDHVFAVKPVGCLVNAEAGEECRTNITKTETPGKLAVAGGGAAGCEGPSFWNCFATTPPLWPKRASTCG
ncbi:MAG: NADH:flavin oxidoreductase [Deltaproteobacteria bacterium]|nr:NADH:flavin oxidoreductase [Deltaproteobacteria bacterium]